MYQGDPSQSSGPWAVHSVYAFTPADQTAIAETNAFMAATNTFDYNGNALVLFYQAQNGALMVTNSVGGSPSSAPSFTAPYEVTPTPTTGGSQIQHMVAISWKNSNNVSNRLSPLAC